MLQAWMPFSSKLDGGQALADRPMATGSGLACVRSSETTRDGDGGRSNEGWAGEATRDGEWFCAAPWAGGIFGFFSMCDPIFGVDH